MFRLLICLAVASAAAGAHAQAAGGSPPENPPEDPVVQAGPGAFVEGWASGLPEPAPAPEAAFYVVRRGVALREQPDGRALRTLRLRDGVRRVEARDGWSRVRAGGDVGWVETAALSNLWVRISKSERTTYVYRGGELWRSFPADVSGNPEGDKVRRAGRLEREEHKIPEGTFYVTRRFAESEYYLAFVLSYPAPHHARQGLESGLISRAQYNAITAAHRDFREPPQGTALGGLIEIHGHGTGRRRAWTRGCVALRNVHMDALWDVVHVGTPVVIEP